MSDIKFNPCASGHNDTLPIREYFLEPTIFNLVHRGHDVYSLGVCLCCKHCDYSQLVTQDGSHPVIVRLANESLKEYISQYIGLLDNNKINPPVEEFYSWDDWNDFIKYHDDNDGRDEQFQH